MEEEGAVFISALRFFCEGQRLGGDDGAARRGQAEGTSRGTGAPSHRFSVPTILSCLKTDLWRQVGRFQLGEIG